MKKTTGMQELYPLTIKHVCLPPWNIADLAGIDQKDLEPLALKDLKHRDPVYPSAFHSDCSNLLLFEPFSKPIEFRSRRLKGLYVWLVVIQRGSSYPMLP